MAFRYLISFLLIQSLSLGKLIVLIQLGAYFDILTWFLASILSLVNEVVALLCYFECLFFWCFCHFRIIVLIPTNLCVLYMRCIMISVLAYSSSSMCNKRLQLVHRVT